MKTYNFEERISPHFELGKLGEEIAREYLEKKGYRIIEQNCNLPTGRQGSKYGEIDLVVLDKDVLVFVEVKTRKGELFGGPEASLNRNKIRRLIRSAQAYLTFRGKNIRFRELSSLKELSSLNRSPSCRIDAVCVVLTQDKKIKRIDHYQNITG